VNLGAAEDVVKELVVSTVNSNERFWAGLFWVPSWLGADKLSGLFGLPGGGLRSIRVWQLFNRGRPPGFWKE